MWEKKFDRELQNKILTLTLERYPHGVKFISKSFGHAYGYHSEPPIDKDIETVINGYSESQIATNLHYLYEHELIEPARPIMSKETAISCFEFKATRHGVDLMLSDGGLSAILNIVTVRFDTQALDVIIDVITKSPEGSAADKKKLLSQLQSLPADATKHLMLKSLDEGLRKMPGVFQWLCEMIPQG
ncbi:TPA: hypothetical protein PXP39_000306 [Yersinia enterocolitica]|nr:hypothetical protein [Yersinia enterocolitica]HDL7830490.1 hypothetical protein [Yersinia enterocolitica]HDL7871346.1 hypothetical protein [Yersinia enterocolitica]HDL7885030.1 hypothetical protein [Yersinia enterocolitica]HDL7892522.1 hypothetical protein [Yersinia enterocolitica]